MHRIATASAVGTLLAAAVIGVSAFGGSAPARANLRSPPPLCQAGPITINDGGPASPYPSSSTFDGGPAERDVVAVRRRRPPGRLRHDRHGLVGVDHAWRTSGTTSAATATTRAATTTAAISATSGTSATSATAPQPPPPPPPSPPTPPTRCRVPRVLGLRLGAAKTKIRRAHCAVGNVRRVRSGRSLRGRVVSQSPRPGTIKRRNFPVKLAVGRA